MLDMWIFKMLAVVAVAALLFKRAAIGPQKQFARLACLSVFSGVGVLSFAATQSDIASWTGAILVLIGLLVAIGMVLTDMQWTVRTRLAASKKD